MLRDALGPLCDTSWVTAPYVYDNLYLTFNNEWINRPAADRYPPSWPTGHSAELVRPFQGPDLWYTHMICRVETIELLKAIAPPTIARMKNDSRIGPECVEDGWSAFLMTSACLNELDVWWGSTARSIPPNADGQHPPAIESTY